MGQGITIDSSIADESDVENKDHSNTMEKEDAIIKNAKDRVERFFKEGYENGFLNDCVNLSNRAITDDMMPSICEWIDKCGDKIRVVRLAKNDITSDGASKIFQYLRINPYVEVLFIQGNNIDDTCMTDLVLMLEENSALKSLYLGYTNLGNGITDTGVNILSKGIKRNKSLRVLNISSNKGVTNKAIDDLEYLVMQTSIEDMDVSQTSIINQNCLEVPLMINAMINGGGIISLSRKDIKDNDVIKICEVMRKVKCDDIKEIDLSSNNLTSKGASVLFDTLSHYEGIKKININSNLIDDNCMASLANMLNKCTFIEQLDIGNGPGSAKKIRNSITDKGIEMLCKNIYNCATVSHLILSFQRNITDVSIPYLHDIIRKAKIDNLDLHQTSIAKKEPFSTSLAINFFINGADQIVVNGGDVSESDLIFIAKAIRDHGLDRLQKIRLSAMKLPVEGANEMFLALSNCKSLTDISLSGTGLQVCHMEMIGDCLQMNKSIRDIDLSWNPLTDAHIEAFALSMIGNTSLESMSLAWNGSISAACTSYLKEFCEKSNIKSIELVGTLIGPENIRDIHRLLAVSIEERNIPISSKTKSAAKITKN